MGANPIPVGKLPVELLARVLASLGPSPAEVRLGPAVGEDACALEVAGGVLIAATDPITLTVADLGRYAVLVNANDVAVSGVRPRWFLATVLLPPGTTEDLVERLFASMRASLEEVGATLVGGHTVEAVDRLTALPTEVVASARDGLVDPGISVVEAAVAAASLGATAMHDPTEGGLASGLHELAVAAGVGIRVDRTQVLWFEPGLEVCRVLGADPWATLASGTLLATFPPDVVVGAREALATLGRPTAAIGVVDAGTGVRDTSGASIPWPERDEVARLLGS